MKYFIILSVVLISCDKLKKSEEMTETGYVVAKQYVPDSRGTANGVGFTSKGDMVFTSHSYGDEEKFTIVFKCQHGVIFTIKNNPQVFANLNEKDSCTIFYKEIRGANTGKVYDYDFIDAKRTGR